MYIRFKYKPEKLLVSMGSYWDYYFEDSLWKFGSKYENHNSYYEYDFNNFGDLNIRLKELIEHPNRACLYINKKHDAIKTVAYEILRKNIVYIDV